MSGCDMPCKHCGKMGDDYPDDDCCLQRTKDCALVREMMDAQDFAEFKIDSLIFDLFLSCYSPQEVKTMGKNIIDLLKKLK